MRGAAGLFLLAAGASATAPSSTTYYDICSMVAFSGTGTGQANLRDVMQGEFPGAWYTAGMNIFGKTTASSDTLKNRFTAALSTQLTTTSTSYWQTTKEIRVSLYNVNTATWETITLSLDSTTCPTTVPTGYTCCWLPSRHWTINNAQVNDNACSSNYGPSTMQQCFGDAFDQSSSSTGCNCLTMAATGTNAVPQAWWAAVPHNDVMWPVFLDASILTTMGSSGTGLSSSSHLAPAAQAESLLQYEATHTARMLLGSTKNFRFYYNKADGQFELRQTEAVALKDHAAKFNAGEAALRASGGVDTENWCGPRRPVFYDLTQGFSSTTTDWLYANKVTYCNQANSQTKKRVWRFDELHTNLNTWADSGYITTIRGDEIEIAVIDTAVDGTQQTNGAAAQRATMQTLLDKGRQEWNAADTTNFNNALNTVLDAETAGRWVLVRDSRALPNGRVDKPNWPGVAHSGDCTSITAATQTILTTTAQLHDSSFTLPCTGVVLPTFTVGGNVQSRFTGMTSPAFRETYAPTTTSTTGYRDITSNSGIATVSSTTVTCGTLNRISGITGSSATTPGVASSTTETRTCLGVTPVGGGTALDNSFSQTKANSYEYLYNREDFVAAAAGPALATTQTSNTLRWMPFGLVLRATGASQLEEVTVSKKSTLSNTADLDLSSSCNWVDSAEGNWPISFADFTMGAYEERKRRATTAATGEWQQNRRYSPAQITPERIDHDLNMCVKNCDAPNILGASAAAALNIATPGCTAGTATATNNTVAPSKLPDYFTSDTCKQYAYNVFEHYSDCMKSSANHWTFHEPDPAALYWTDLGWDTVAYVDSAYRMTGWEMRRLCQCKEMPSLVTWHEKLINNCAGQLTGLQSYLTLLRISSVVQQMDSGCQLDRPRRLQTRHQGQLHQVEPEDRTAGYCYHAFGGANMTVASADWRAKYNPPQWEPPRGCKCIEYTGPVAGDANNYAPASCTLLFSGYMNYLNPNTQTPGCYVEESDECLTSMLSDANISVYAPGGAWQARPLPPQPNVFWTLCEPVQRSLLERKQLIQFRDLVAKSNDTFKVLIVNQPSTTPSSVVGTNNSRILTNAWTNVWVKPVPFLNDVPAFRTVGTQIRIDFPAGTTFVNGANLASVAALTADPTQPIQLDFTVPTPDREISYKEFRAPTVELCKAARESTSCCMSSEISSYIKIAKAAYGFTIGNSGNKTDKMTLAAKAFQAQCAALGEIVPDGAVGLDLEGISSWQGATCKPVWDSYHYDEVVCDDACIVGLSVAAGLLAAAAIIAVVFGSSGGGSSSSSSAEQTDEGKEMQEVAEA
eukprot:TRINITY_DN59898_c0_g1_i1.p1 TRINITY_DN59898_c0_g1~~TRINITY_DN59898_c0_g1_i1.p1  ORF type:complete len:1347 (+),score=449.62 TRINITY_DN59898_c0_g1_i1:113-4042(+)